MTSPVLTRTERLLDRYGRTRRGLARRLSGLLERLWSGLDPYDGDQVAEFARQAAAAVTAAQGVSAAATEAYLRAVLTQLDAPPPQRARLVELPEQLRPTDLVEVYQRPAREVRWLESTGLDGGEARNRGRARLVVTADDDLQLAEREASRQVLSANERVIGWRRVLRPELSESGSCGLCIAASDRQYSTGDLREIHDRCKCVTMPITAEHDPGLRINRADLDRLYAAAGGTEAAKLKRVRVVVHEHGELGPILREAGHEFRGPRKAARAQQVPDTKARARAEIAALEPTYARLQERAAGGEDVSGPLEWQRARLELLRSQLTD